MLEAKTDNGSNESSFADVEKPEANNRSNPALDRKGSGTRQSCTDTQWLGLPKWDAAVEHQDP